MQWISPRCHLAMFKVKNVWGEQFKSYNLNHFIKFDLKMVNMVQGQNCVCSAHLSDVTFLCSTFTFWSQRRIMSTRRRKSTKQYFSLWNGRHDYNLMIPKESIFGGNFRILFCCFKNWWIPRGNVVWYVKNECNAQHLKSRIITLSRDRLQMHLQKLSVLIWFSLKSWWGF